MRYSPLYACALLVALAGCGGGIGAANNINPTTAEIRFVNGAPDQGALDLDVSGTAIAAGIPVHALSAYTPIAAGTYTLAAAPTGTTAALPGATTTGVSFTAGLNYTVVVGGSNSTDRLLCVFPEPLFATATNAAVVNFHNCSPGSPSPMAVGTFTISTGVLQQIGPPINIKLTSGAQAVQASAATTGTGIYAINPSVAQLLPSSLDTNDVNNFLPFTGAGGEEDLNLSAYIVDGTTTPGTTAIVGSFDGN